MGENRALDLDLTAVPEWDLEDLRNATLGTELAEADPDQAREMLARLRLELPDSLEHRHISEPPSHAIAPFETEFVPDPERYDYHLVEVPVSILVPEGQRLVRLRVTADLNSDGREPPVAWDLFPRDTYGDSEHNLGTLGVDVGKLLTFVPVPAAGALDLTIKAPLKWKSHYTQIRTSDRMSNPADWYVTDRAVDNGFTGSLIVRVARNGTLDLEVGVVGEIRQAGLLGRFTRARFRAGSQLYGPIAP